MNNLYSYINNAINTSGTAHLKLSEKDKKHLLDLDDEYKELMSRVRSEYNEKDITNLDDELDKFLRARKYGRKYYPILKTSECKYEESHIIDDLVELKNKFINFPQCFLSKYYIEVINRKIRWCRYAIDVCKGMYKEWSTNIPDRELFDEAMKVLDRKSVV